MGNARWWGFALCALVFSGCGEPAPEKLSRNHKIALQRFAGHLTAGGPAASTRLAADTRVDIDEIAGGLDSGRWGFTWRDADKAIGALEHEAKMLRYGVSIQRLNSDDDLGAWNAWRRAALGAIGNALRGEDWKSAQSLSTEFLARIGERDAEEKRLEASK